MLPAVVEGPSGATPGPAVMGPAGTGTHRSRCSSSSGLYCGTTSEVWRAAGSNSASLAVRCGPKLTRCPMVVRLNFVTASPRRGLNSAPALKHRRRGCGLGGGTDRPSAPTDTAWGPTGLGMVRAWCLTRGSSVISTAGSVDSRTLTELWVRCEDTSGTTARSARGV